MESQACALQYAKLLKNMHYEIELQFPYYRTDPSARKDWAKLLKRFSCEGIGFLTTTLPTLGKAMISSFQSDSFLCPSAFKKQKGTVLPMFYHGLFSRIYYPNGIIRNNPDTAAMRLLNQLCFMFYKLEVEYTERQVEKVMEKYYEAEKSCQRVFLREDDQLLKIARDIVTDIFKDFDPKDIRPNVSNGVLATGEVGANKFIASRKYSEIHKFYAYYEYFVPTFNTIADQLKNNSAEKLRWYKTLKPEKSGISKMCCVNKNADGPRTISMEPAEYMYIQQGLKHTFCKHLEKKTFNQINFLDQSFNQREALLSSIDGSSDTYDFSSASDRVSVTLVTSLFRDVPRVLDAIMAVRSSHTITPYGEKIRLHKYAPMGSAMCFPVMATCIYAIAKAHDPDLPVLVYGDDLIVESDSVYSQLSTNFQRYGLKINTNKSFTRGNFRESCGCDAFNGYLITPIRLKKGLQCKDPESFAALVESSNQLYNAGYWHLAGCLREIIQLNASVNVPTSSVHQTIDGLSFCFATDATDNMRIIFDKNNNLHYQKKILSLNVPKVTTSLSGDDGYLMALLCRDGTQCKPSELVIRDTTKNAMLRLEWKDMYSTCEKRCYAA